VRDESVLVSHHAAELLGTLGVERQWELGSVGRKVIADGLADALDVPASSQMIFDIQAWPPAPVGPLYDSIFGTIARVVDPSMRLAVEEQVDYAPAPI
jgi:hypothetical protein